VRPAARDGHEVRTDIQGLHAIAVDLGRLFLLGRDLLPGRGVPSVDNRHAV